MKSNIKTILFDLDGTLLPMQQDEFTTAYFDRLSKKLAPYGYEPKRLIDGVWHGTKAMVKNNGTQTNEQVFWKEFAELFDEKVYSDIEKFNEFYATDFDKLKSYCGFNEQANQTIKRLKETGCTLVLASNPVFPMVAQKKRMLWAGVNPDDFALLNNERKDISKYTRGSFVQLLNYIENL